MIRDDIDGSVAGSILGTRTSRSPFHPPKNGSLEMRASPGFAQNLNRCGVLRLIDPGHDSRDSAADEGLMRFTQVQCTRGF